MSLTLFHAIIIVLVLYKQGHPVGIMLIFLVSDNPLSTIPGLIPTGILHTSNQQPVDWMEMRVVRESRGTKS